VGMANGEISFNQLFMMGQIKIKGNMSKVMELRPMLTRPLKEI